MKLVHTIGAIATRLVCSALALSTLALFTVSISAAETDLNKVPRWNVEGGDRRLSSGDGRSHIHDHGNQSEGRPMDG